jgi:hypothetical protein
MLKNTIARHQYLQLIIAAALLFLFVSIPNVQAQTPLPEDPEASDEANSATPEGIGAEGSTTCFDCHVDLGDNHTDVAQVWEESVHGKAGIGCDSCHGGNPTSDEMKESMSEEFGFIGIPNRSMIPNVCGDCHSDVERMRQYNIPTDQYSKYIESVHGKNVGNGDTQVAICSDCHGSHDVKKASDPSAEVYPLNIPDLCAKCHSDADRMERYNIPTNQYDVYKESVHGQALLGDQDTRAPNCASCHGSHAAKPPSDEEVANVCGKCHTATQEFYNESLHSKIDDGAPKCLTCHGAHDVPKPGEHMFLHAETQEQHCGTCHIDDETFRMGATRFELPEDRRCDTCHHVGSWIMTQVTALHTALTAADQAYKRAEETIQEAASRGMIVNDAENKLAESRTSLIRARAVLHTTKLTSVTDLTDDAISLAETAQSIAETKLGENLFRRQAMIVAIAAITINILVLIRVKRVLSSKKPVLETNTSVTNKIEESE